MQECTVLDVFDFVKRIQRKEIESSLMQLAIISNPHTKNPKELHKKLQSQLKSLDAENSMQVDEQKVKKDLDRLKKRFG